MQRVQDAESMPDLSEIILHPEHTRMNTQPTSVSESMDLEIEIIKLCTCDGPWGQQGCDIHRDEQTHSHEVASISDELFWLSQHY